MFLALCACEIRYETIFVTYCRWPPGMCVQGEWKVAHGVEIAIVPPSCPGSHVHTFAPMRMRVQVRLEKRKFDRRSC